MIKAKGTVRPRSVFILCAVANVACQWGIEVTITSVQDSTHTPGSLHPKGAAVDIRSKAPFHDADEKRKFLDAVLRRLGLGYQGILEAPGTPNEHFHIEFDPS